MESGLGFIKSSKILLLLFGVFGVLIIASLSVSITNSSTISDEAFLASEARKEIIERVDKLESNDGGKPEEPEGPEEPGSLCETDVCKASAKSILSKMKMDQNPCEDFYKFTCGKYIEDAVIPEGKLDIGTFDDLNKDIMDTLLDILQGQNDDNTTDVLKKARAYFKSCTDMDSIDAKGKEEYKSIFDINSKFGGYPLLNSKWKPGLFNKEKALGGVLYDYNEALLVQGYVYLDAQNTSQNILYIDQASLGLLRANFMKPNKYKKILDAYKALQLSTTTALAQSIGLQNLTESSIKNDLKDMFKFETDIAKIMVPKDERRNSTRMYNPMELSEISENYKQIKWTDYLNELTKDAGISIDDNERIIVVEPEYLTRLNELLNETKPKVISNYIHWRMLLQTLPNGPTELKKHYDEFIETAMGITGESPRDEKCVKIVAAPFDGMGGLGFVVAHDYVKRKFDDNSKKEVNSMVKDLRSSFKELVNESTWMDTPTQKEAKEKVDAIVQSLGYPDWLMDSDKLETNYRELGELKSDTLLTNIKIVRRFESKTSFSALRAGTDRKKWPLHPAVVNAVYSPMRNSITFPAGILQYPFYKSGNPMYLNFGSIGVVIGHEITHGFDDQGSQYDKEGNVKKWWSDSSLSAFIEEKKCIVEQYNNYRVPEVSENAHVNGVLTQGENIADNGGLRESFRAYEKWLERKKTDPKLPGLEKFSHQQMFFIAYSQTWCEKVKREKLENQILSDPHSPGKFRSWGAVSNSKSFSDAFNCKKSDAMSNGDESCVLW